MRRVGPETADAGRCKDSTLVLACHLQNVPQPVDANLPGQPRLLLGHDTEQCCQVIDAVDMMLLHDVGQLLAIGDVCDGRGATFGQLSLGFCTGDISGNHMVAAILFTQGCSEFRANLAG